MATTNNLPLEIWEEIVSFLPVSTLSSVCLVSKAFHIPGTRLLYRYIDLNTVHQTVGCLKTLEKSTLAARSARHLWMNYKVELYPEGSVVMQGFFRLISRSLKRLLNLRTLEIRVVHREFPHLSEYFDYLFDGCNYPHLTMLLLYMPITRNLVSFLNRHQSTLKTLFLVPLTYYNSEQVAGKNWLFPKLTWFHGADTVTPNFLSSCSLPAIQRFEVTCSLETPGTAIQDLIKSIKKTCGDRRLTQLNFNRSGWNVELIEEIAAQSLSSMILSVHCIWFDDLPEEDMILGQERLDLVADSLSRLSSLRSLYWTVETKFGEHPPPSLTLDEELKVVLRFGNVCPSLVRCQIPHGLVWTRCIKNVWMPNDDISKGFTVVRWFFDQLHSRQYPALDDLLESLTVYSSLYSFIKEVVDGFRDAGNKLGSDAAEDKAYCKSRTLELMAVSMVLRFWYSSGFKKNPAYCKFSKLYS
ncbi:hypothetical protein WG66_014320 [Moniliophthora roreri]|uniref:F-box domain-containing protein n=1 Tax=Moniliophthora roreri TaxID=221103 RepID=A0A0W0GET6_MONRR|nr:hypothetical protein WG66_014320 [Moniliophthora roreri]